MILSDNIKDKVKGCIYGQAIGDALGVGTEFMTRKDVKKYYPNGLIHYEQIVQDRHRSRFKIGEWTDDTDMMICVAKARNNNVFEIQQIAHNFKDWFNNNPMGIGRHTFNVLAIGDYDNKYFEASKLFWTLNNQTSAGNGGVMRTSILGTSSLVKEQTIADVCRLTHYDPRCVGSCVIVTRIIQELIFNNVTLTHNEILDLARQYDQRIIKYILNAESFDNLSNLNIDDDEMGYTLKTLSVALWCLWHVESFKEGLLKVVNSGGDADTNAAVACSILGAKYGFSDIPEYYVEKLLYKNILEEIFIKAIADEESVW